MVMNTYQANMYGMPFVRDLYLKAYYTLNSHFYGYINSDIIISNSIFPFLKLVKQRMDRGKLSQKVCY